MLIGRNSVGFYLEIIDKLLILMLRLILKLILILIQEQIRIIRFRNLIVKLHQIIKLIPLIPLIINNSNLNNKHERTTLIKRVSHQKKYNASKAPLNRGAFLFLSNL